MGKWGDISISLKNISSYYYYFADPLCQLGVHSFTEMSKDKWKPVLMPSNY